MSEPTTRPRRYRFGPMPQRGLLGEFRAGQLAMLGVTVLGALGAIRNLPAAGGPLIAVLLLAAGALGAFARPRGRGLDEWVPVAMRFLTRRALGRDAWRSPLPSAGASVTSMALPDELADLELLEVPFQRGTVGVCKGLLDRTYTAILAVQTQGLSLADTHEQERAGAQWGTALASLAAEQTPVCRVAWVERSVPSDGDALGRYLADERDEAIPLEAASMRSYLELIEEPGTVGKQHELFLALQVSQSSARAQIREEGGGDDGACRVLLRELTAWAETLGAAQLTVRGVLTPRMLARVLRTHFDPFVRADLARMEAARGHGEGGVDPVQAGPTATEEGWSNYRTDGAIHTTYWISAWPRFDVGMQFLAPLLLSGDVVRSTAVVIDVLSPSEAERTVEHERISDVAEAGRRQRGGGLVTARQRRRFEATAAREDELSRGHALTRHVGFVTVSSPIGAGTHRRDCLQLETIARRARLEVRPMYGEQPAALTFTLPLCRGLR
jgi:Putative type VII ESX secretion system translocon, EccE